MKRLEDTTISLTAIAMGAATAATPAWMATTVASAGLLLAFGAATMIYGAVVCRAGPCAVAMAGRFCRRARSLGRVDRRPGPLGDRPRAHSHRGTTGGAYDIADRTAPVSSPEGAALTRSDGRDPKAIRLFRISSSTRGIEMSELVQVATLTLVMLTVFGTWWFVSASVHKRDALGRQPNPQHTLSR